MAEERVQRKLAAILVADVVGYSRMMGVDEAGTLAQMKSLRRELIDPKIAEYGGRVFKNTGDGVLIEFPSAVDAVQHAVDLRRAMARRIVDVPEDRRMLLRCGINLGDVIIDGDDLYGEGVNIAARLEGLAEPGGICISGSVYEQVRNKIDAVFVDLGERQVKNIAEPIRVYAVDFSLTDGGTADRARELAPPDKPSIAVLPFDNMSNDPEQDFLADGLTEDIITSLSKISTLFVIARNSTFSYKGTSPDVRQVARELGVRNVLEGSVQKAGNRVRITAQLIDASNGNHLWAERYDRELSDVFDLQDEITQEVTTAMEIRLAEGEQVRLRRRQTNDLAAWECYTRGQSYLRIMNRQDNAQAHDLVRQAVEIDPEFASAWSLLAWIHLMDARIVGGETLDESLEKAEDCIERSLALDVTQPDALMVKAQLRLHQRRFDEALALSTQAIDFGPNVADCYTMQALVLNYIGRPDEALRLAEQGMRLSPFYPDFYLGNLGISYRLLGRYDEAISADQERLSRNPNNSFSNFRLAAVYEELGQHEKTKEHVAEALRRNPGLTVSQIRFSEPYSDEKELERFVALLRQAGLSE